MSATYDEVEYVLAEIIAEATGEPRVGRFESTLAKAALARLRELGLALSTPPADDVREALAREIADGGEPFDEDYRAADDVLRCFEVRPHGTVTPPADDVREALAEEVFAVLVKWRTAALDVQAGQVALRLSGFFTPKVPSTPAAAADVREAVMNALACHRRNVTVGSNSRVCSCGWASATVDYGSYAFDGHIADAVAAEVRPHRTVTDAEATACMEARESHRYSLVRDSHPARAKCTCGWEGLYSIEWALHRERAGLEAAREVHP